MMKAEDWNVPKTQMIFQNLIPHQQKSNISVLVSTGYGVTPQKKHEEGFSPGSVLEKTQQQNTLNSEVATRLC